MLVVLFGLELDSAKIGSFFLRSLVSISSTVDGVSLDLGQYP